MTAMVNTRRIKPGTARAPGRTVHTIKVTLAGSRPPIWRRLQVPSAITLRALHDILQAAFGWEDYHMWVFETPQSPIPVCRRRVWHECGTDAVRASSAPGRRSCPRCRWVMSR
jgi:hypothetical protein